MKTICGSFKLFILMTVITGVIYPLIVCITGNSLFPDKARGSFVTERGNNIGSELIGQKFSSEKYFWPRPSAVDYNPLPSAGSNLSPSSAVLLHLFRQRSDEFSVLNHLPEGTRIPLEMLFASASGVDPHCSPEAAYLQIGRVSKSRGFDRNKTAQLHRLVEQMIISPQLGFLGRPQINVFLLNLELDKLSKNGNYKR